MSTVSIDSSPQLAPSAGEAPTATETAAGLVVEDRFAIIPEWLLDSDVSDAAIRLYAVLLRYGQSSGARMPGRATLARRLRKRSTDSVDRALRELVAVGAVSVEHRYAGGQRLTNLYHLHARQQPAQPDAEPDGGSRTDAATQAWCPGSPHAQPARPQPTSSRIGAAIGSRTTAAGVAATVRHNPEHFTQTTSSPRARPRCRPRRTSRLRPGIGGRRRNDSWHKSGTDLDAFLARCRSLRADAQAPAGRWSRPTLLAALQTAVNVRGWPADVAASARLAVAADPATRSPMRVAEGGPWWDQQPARPPVPDPVGPGSAGKISSRPALPAAVSLERAEAELAETDGLRVVLQRAAREQLAAEGAPVTKITVLRRAHDLLIASRPEGSEAC